MRSGGVATDNEAQEDCQDSRMDEDASPSTSTGSSLSDQKRSDEELKSINIVATTTYIPNWIFCARKNLNPKFVNDVKNALLNIPIDSEVAKNAKIRRFVQLPSNYLEEYRSRIE